MGRRTIRQRGMSLPPASAAPGSRGPAPLTERAEHATAMRYLCCDGHRATARFVPRVAAVWEAVAQTFAALPPVDGGER